MTILGIKDLGEDVESGLQMQLQIHRIAIDGDDDMVTVYYRIVLLSPKGKAVSVIKNNNFIRFNRPAIMDGNKEIKPANMKFDALKLSPIGQGILGMLQIDINNIQKFDTLEQDLEQL